MDHGRQLRQRRRRHPADPDRGPGPVGGGTPGWATTTSRSRSTGSVMRSTPSRSEPTGTARPPAPPRNHPGRSDRTHRARADVRVAGLARSRHPRVADRRQPERRGPQRGRGERGGRRLGLRSLDRGGPCDGTGSALADRAAPALADGVHAWRIRATDGAGNTAIVPGPERVLVDTTAPKLELHAAPANWVNRAEMDLTATDNLQAVLGLPRSSSTSIRPPTAAREVRGSAPSRAPGHPAGGSPTWGWRA